jgi:cation:H+ antiporter
MAPFGNPVVDILFNISILLVSILFLWKGADELVERAGRIATSLGISDLVIGLTVVALGTSAPEFAVTLNAALSDKADISVGNIVGSNIFNLGFILGTVALVRSIESSRKLVYRDGIFMILVTLLLLFFFSDLRLARYEGFILMGILITYLVYLFIQKEPLEEEEISHDPARVIDYILLPVSIAAVVLGGHYLVESASFLARHAGVSEWVIGVTIIAAGTSAPEMATSLAAVLKGKHGMSAGNLIGSDLFNILGVLGLAGVLNPLKIIPEAYASLAMLTGMVTLVVVFLRTGWRLSRLEGGILVLIGIIRWVLDFMQ